MPEKHKLIYSILNKGKLFHQWKDSLFYIFINRMIDLIIIINQAHHCYQLYSQFDPTFFYQYEIKRIMSVNFYVIPQHPMKYSAFLKYLRKNGNTVQQYTSYI